MFSWRTCATAWGPFLGTYLREVHRWDAGRVGIALAASQIGTVLAQTPAGALIDRIVWKRVAIAVAAAVVAAGCVVLYLVPTLAAVVAAQALIGAMAAVFPPAIAALTLGLVGRAALPRRTGRNEAFNHGGNVIAAALAGGWAVRDPLPGLPIPLREPDPDILIDLAALVTRVYDLGRYARTLRRGTPLPETSALTPEDRAWAEAVSRPAPRASS